MLFRNSCVYDSGCNDCSSSTLELRNGIAPKLPPHIVLVAIDLREGNVLLYLTSAGSKARAVRTLSIKKGEHEVARRTGLVVASHCDVMKRNLWTTLWDFLVLSVK